MERLRKISISLLSITAALGLVRGYRMSNYSGDDSLLFPYPQDMIKASVFSNYIILGWIVFSMVGIFSILAIIGVVRKIRNYAYLMIIEGIFVSFLTLIHIVVSGFGLIHLCILPICIAVLILGIIQVPKEF